MFKSIFFLSVVFSISLQAQDYLYDDAYESDYELIKDTISTDNQIKASSQIGFRGEYGVSTLLSNYKAKHATSYSFGLVKTLPLYSNFSLLTEVSYSVLQSSMSLTFKKDSKTPTRFLDTDVQMNYISIAPIFRLYVTSSRSFFIELGTKLSYLLSSDYGFDYSRSSLVPLSELTQMKQAASNFNIDFNKLDFGIVIGTGYKFGSYVELFGRAIIGIPSVLDYSKPKSSPAATIHFERANTELNENDIDDIKTQNWMATVGLGFFM